MIQSYQRTPQWEVTIRRPDYTADGLVFEKVDTWSKIGKGGAKDAVFVSNEKASNGFNTFTDLIAYEYSNALNSPEGAFSLTFVPQIDLNGLTWKDKIKKRDLVIIKEFGKVRYIGLVTSTGYSSQMNGDKPQRTITATGLSLGGILQRFSLPMNVYLWDTKGQTAKSANDSLVAALNSNVNEDQDLSKVLGIITDSFYKVVFSSQEVKGTVRIFKELTEYRPDPTLSMYPQIFSVFQVDSNNLWEIYRSILPSPVYEIFGRFDPDTGKYILVTRETPFDPEDWKELRKTKINNLFLLSHNLNETDNEIYTHFYSTMPNTAFSENENYARADLNQVSRIDTEKMPIYGYKQMQAMFKFYDISKDTGFSPQEMLKRNSDRMYEWFKNNGDFQSGSITMMNVPDSEGKMIDIGERIEYLGGEFYVEAYKRSASYPDTMKTDLTITRGFVYDKGGNQYGKIPQLGKKIYQAEKVQ
jgi:hypothetical protein